MRDECLPYVQQEQVTLDPVSAQQRRALIAAMLYS